MKYLSVCSGIEAATVAWHRLGWQPSAFAQFDPDHNYANGPDFPSRVLAHHYTDVPNLGDMTRYKDWPDAAIDVLVGGTPCQSFSVAGLRKGLADPRGNLALTFLGVADRYGPEWLIWENVPGVLSQDDGRAFGSILGGMAELGYHVSYRVLDAQYVRVDGLGRAVPQRRRRVFVIGNSRDWRRASAVLFEPESLSGDIAPSREAGKGIAPTISARPSGGGGLGTDFDLDGGLVAKALNAKGGSGRSDGESETFVAHPLLAKSNSSHDDSMETYVAHALRADGFDASEDGTGRGTPLVATFDPRNITSKANRTRVEFGTASNTLHEQPLSLIACVADTLTKSYSKTAAKAGKEIGLVNPIISFSCKVSGADAGETAPTLRAMGHSESHANAGGQLAVAMPYTLAIRGRGDSHQLEYRQDGTANAVLTPNGGRAGIGVGAVAFDLRNGTEDDVSQTLQAAGLGTDRGGNPNAIPHTMQNWAVRRLTPLECERLQGFPDGYTAIPVRGKIAADGPRYKVLGNSMAVNVMRWLGRRIELVKTLTN